RGPVASVAIYTTKPMADVQSIALDTSSRTSAALVSVLCARRFKIAPRLESRGPDLHDMLESCDAALIIGDNALFQTAISNQSPISNQAPISNQSAISNLQSAIQKVDLGDEWTALTGLPFVWAFWAGHPDALDANDVAALQQARDEGVERPEQLARE